MQHAEKEKPKQNKKQTFSQISPHKLKRTRDPQKKSTYKLKRGLNYTENREPELHSIKYLYTKEKKQKHIKISPLSCVQCVAV